MEYVTDAASRVGQLVVSATQQGLPLTDAHIQQYGRYAMVASALYYVAVTFKNSAPADAKYAIDAHLPSGFDRSIIASRLEQRHTKAIVESQLGIKRLREAVRTAATREGKLCLWREILESTLVGIVVTAYTHSLTLSLWSLKNTSRVLVFVLRKREVAAEQSSANPQKRGLQGKLRTWWQGGTKGLIADTLLRRMTEQVEKQASPFASVGIHDDEEEESAGDDRAGDGSASLSPQRGRDGYAEHARTPARDGGFRCSGASSSAADSARHTSAAAQAFLSGEFSVHRLLCLAIPRITACARAAVHDTLAHLPEAHKLDLTGDVRGSSLQYIFGAIAARMEKTACVPAWLQNPPRVQTTAGAADTVSPTITRASPPPLRPEGIEADEEEEEDIVDYPSGSTMLLGPDGRPLPFSGHGGRTGRSRSLLEELGSDPALHHQVSTAEREAEEEAARREQLARQQTVGFFQELIHHNSFAELVLVAAEAQLAETFREARDLSSVRGYDVVTDSCKLLLAITALEACRQKMNDTDFVVAPHLKLFCEELIRSTCSQRVLA